jgi:serine/threonine protein kinase
MQSIANIPPSEARTERVFNRRYHVERVIDQSSFGTRYEARDLVLDEAVCLEVLPHYLAADRVWETARSDLRKLAALRHARLVEIYGFGVFRDGSPFVVTEHLAGVPLHRVLDPEALSLARVLRLGRQICEAVRAAHLASVLHGALEPAHVTLLDPGSERERVKLGGFGLAAGLSARRFEALARVAPIHNYVSPERIQGQAIDARSDVYALGALLYELVAGAPPFRGHNSGELLCRHLDDVAEPPSYRLGSTALPLRVFDKIVLRCLAKRPEQRYRTVAELERDLARLERASGAHSRPPVVQTRCVHRPAPASHVGLRRPLPKVIINDDAL